MKITEEKEVINNTFKASVVSDPMKIIEENFPLEKTMKEIHFN